MQALCPKPLANITTIHNFSDAIHAYTKLSNLPGDMVMTLADLLELIHAKGVAYRKLVEARNRWYVPSSLSKSTADDRKIALEFNTRAEQVAYDNLADELMVRLEIMRHE